MSTNYTHFTNLAFDTLFARGPDGAETQVFGASGTLNITQLLAGASTVSVHKLFRDSNAGDSSNTTELRIGNNNDDQGYLRLRFQNAPVTSTPSVNLAGVFRNNANSASYTAGSFTFTKASGSDAATMGLTVHNGTALQTHYFVFSGGSSTIGLTGKTLRALGPVQFAEGAVGVTDASNATAGHIGQSLRSAVTTATNFTAASGVYTNLTSLSLPAGDYLVTGQVVYTLNGATVTGYAKAAVSTNSGNTTTDHVLADNEMTGLIPASGNVDRSVNISAYRVNVSSTTTIYLKGFISTVSAGTPQYYARLSALRIR